jgi:methionine biosynthesis protein MetW
MDHPLANDNRNYDYTHFEDETRPEYRHLVAMIEPNARVLDLGCGNGALLALLKKERDIIEEGMELSESGIKICGQRGLNVRLGRIDERLPYPDDSFDFAVCNVTIQMVLYPEVLLREMKRVARWQIISFPNFAFWKNRFELLFEGRMPRKMLFGYTWYTTGHIHQLSSRDFLQIVDDVGGLTIREVQMCRPPSHIKWFLIKQFPNLFQMLFIYKLEKA